MNKFSIGDRVKVVGKPYEFYPNIYSVHWIDPYSKFIYLNIVELQQIRPFAEAELELTDDQPEVKIERLEEEIVFFDNSWIKLSATSDLKSVIQTVNQLVDFCNALNSKEDCKYTECPCENHFKKTEEKPKEDARMYLNGIRGKYFEGQRWLDEKEVEDLISKLLEEKE